MAKKTTMSAEERKAEKNARARQRRAEKTGRHAVPVTYDPAVALAEATTIAEAVMARRDLEAEQALAAAIDATTPPTPEPTVTTAPASKTRAYCAICAEHFHTQSRHWRTSRFLARHQVRPYTDPAFLAWLEKHAAAEGLTLPQAS